MVTSLVSSPATASARRGRTVSQIWPTHTLSHSHTHIQHSHTHSHSHTCSHSPTLIHTHTHSKHSHNHSHSQHSYYSHSHSLILTFSHTHAQERCKAPSPDCCGGFMMWGFVLFSHPQDRLICPPPPNHKGKSSVLSRWSAGPAFLGATGGEGQGQASPLTLVTPG